MRRGRHASKVGTKAATKVNKSRHPSEPTSPERAASLLGLLEAAERFSTSQTAAICAAICSARVVCASPRVRVAPRLAKSRRERDVWGTTQTVKRGQTYDVKNAHKHLSGYKKEADTTEYVRA